jgi:hypothetical protein
MNGCLRNSTLRNECKYLEATKPFTNTIHNLHLFNYRGGMLQICATKELSSLISSNISKVTNAPR